MKKLLILSSLFIFLGTSSFAQSKKHKHHKHHKHMMKHKSDEKKMKDKEK
jgi:hypothetical protein